MGVITNGSGGGGGNVRYDSATDTVQIKYNGQWVDWKRAYIQFDGVIYDNGDTGFEWDNPDPYVIGGGFAWSLEGGVTFNAANINLVTPSSGRMRGCGISTPIDFTPYMSLKCLANVNGTDVTKALDISTLTGSYYVTLYSTYGHIGGGVSYYYKGFGYSLIKSLCESGQSNNMNTPSASEPTVYVKKVWLE